MTQFKDLIGMTLVKIDGDVGDDCIVFTSDDGRKFCMEHYQDCCESVNVEDICGDLKDLLGPPIIKASEDTSNENPEGVEGSSYEDSFTWTFYNIATAKGHVTIRWYGSSNGYYSESVDFDEIKQ